MLGDGISLIVQQAVEQYLDREEEKSKSRCYTIELPVSFYPILVIGGER